MAQPLVARVSRPYLAGVVEKGDTRGLEPRAHRHAGSSPASCTCHFAGVAQLGEHIFYTDEARGSSPLTRTCRRGRSSAEERIPARDEARGSPPLARSLPQ